MIRVLLPKVLSGAFTSTNSSVATPPGVNSELPVTSKWNMQKLSGSESWRIQRGGILGVRQPFFVCAGGLRRSKRILHGKAVDGYHLEMIGDVVKHALLS